MKTTDRPEQVSVTNNEYNSMGLEIDQTGTDFAEQVDSNPCGNQSGNPEKDHGNEQRNLELGNCA
jgi:hypothetical protein